MGESEYDDAGILGILAMLCEASPVGLRSIGKIPKPENIQLSEWLTSYPAMGFIFVINSEKALVPLREVGLKTEVLGRFTRDDH